MNFHTLRKYAKNSCQNAILRLGTNIITGWANKFWSIRTFGMENAKVRDIFRNTKNRSNSDIFYNQTTSLVYWK